jgi:c-di-GMP-binding flagellar brake protein YcgR
MGAPSPSRKNQYASQGLEPGVTLRLEVSVGERLESFATVVEEVNDERLAVLVPMARLRLRRLSTGSIVHAEYVHRNRRCGFISEVIGHSDDGVHEYLRVPAHVDSFDRRSNFRLETSLKPSSLYRVVVDPGEAEADPELAGCTLVDLSEGGCCLSSRQRIDTGTRIGLVVDLPQVGSIQTRMRVVTVDEPRTGQLNRRWHCSFTDISPGDRDRIARFLMRRQLEMRRRGQL